MDISPLPSRGVVTGLAVSSPSGRYVLSSGCLTHNCFSEDTRLLTDCGFLFLDEALQRPAARFACYNEKTAQLEYHAATAFVCLPRAQHRMVEFTQRGDSGCVSLLVTDDHDMYVQLSDTDGLFPSFGDTASPYSKLPASNLVHEADPRPSFRMLSCAVNGAQPQCSSPPPFIQALSLLPHQVNAFIQLYGFWLGDGSMNHRHSGRVRSGPRPAVQFRLHKKGDVSWLRHKLREAGQRQLSSHRCSFNEFECITVRDPVWCCWFDAEFKKGRRGRASRLREREVTGSPSCSSPRSPAPSFLQSTLQPGETQGDDSGDDSDYEPHSLCDLTLFSDDSSSSEGELEGCDGRPLRSSRPITAAKCLGNWVLESLTRSQLRLLLEGVRRADGARLTGDNRISTSSVRFRDELIVALLHAGFTAWFETQYEPDVISHFAAADPSRDHSLYSIGYVQGLQSEQQAAFVPCKSTATSWTVRYAEPDCEMNGSVASAPVLHRASDVKRVADYDGRVWCVQVPHGLLVAQRAVVDAAGCVTSATRPVIVGNCNIGVIYKNSAQLSMAIEYYERALKANPNFHIAASNLAIALTDKGTSVKNEGRIDEGISYYKRALHHNSKYPSSWYNLGVAYAEKGRADDAKVCLTGDHRVLTRSGWQSITRVQVGDEVLSFNIASYATEWKPVRAVQSHAVVPGKEADELYRMQGSGMDVIATRDHRMLLACIGKGREGGLRARKPIAYETVGQLLPPALSYTADTDSRRTGFTECPARAVVAAGINCQPAVKIVIPSLEQVSEWWWRGDEQRCFLQFLGFWLSDGWLDVTNGIVAISQQKQAANSWLAEELLPSVFPRWWRRCPSSRDPTELVYKVRCPPLYEYLRLMAIGPLGYNPRDQQQLRSYPHFTEDEGLAAEEQQSGYYQANSSSGWGSAWTEDAMLAALTGVTPLFPTRTQPSTPRSVSISATSTDSVDEDELMDAEDVGDEEVGEDDAPLLVEAVGEEGDADVRIPRAEVVGDDNGDKAVGSAMRAAGKIACWNAGLWIVINGRWFYLKRWLGDQQQIADVYSRLSRQQAVALLDGFCRADGRRKTVQYDVGSGEPMGCWECCSSSFPLIDQLQLIAQLAGARVSLSLAVKAGKTSTIDGRTVTVSADHWRLSLAFSKATTGLPFTMAPLAQPVDVSDDLDGRGYYQYVDDGRVFCISVQDNANFLTQRLSLKRTMSSAASGPPLPGVRLGVVAHSVYVGNCYEMAVLFDSKCAEAYNNLGVIYKDRGNLDQAIHFYHEALQANPAFSQTLNNLSVIYTMLGKLDEAYEYCSRAIRTNPHYAEALNNLGVLYRDEGRIEEAIQSYAECLRIDALSKNAGQNRLLALNSLTRLDPALRMGAAGGKEGELPGVNGANGVGPAAAAAPSFVMAVSDPSAASAPSASVSSASSQPSPTLFSPANPLSCLLPAPSPEQDQQLMDAVYEAHRQWGLTFSALFERDRYSEWPECKRVKERQLRVGYLSADFFVHSVSYFIEAPLTFRDRGLTHVVCYSNVARKDKKTSYFEKLCDTWRSIHDKSSREVAEIVRRDRIDVLIELTGHTAGNRLDVMALKPAPVQMTWIGYPNTTGLPSIDYRITDSVVDPPNTTQKCTETLLRLPGPFLCYTPPPDAPPVTSTPALKNGFVTFGSFNNLAKVNDRVLAVWCAILHSVPFSRMLMKCKPFASPTVVAKMHAKFAAFGIPAARVDLISLLPTTTEHLDAYAAVDISVDTFPYAGTTTTCEALYMGVPVITYHKKQPSLHAHNVGATLLSRLGGGEGGGGGGGGVGELLIADSERAYVQQAVRLASDINRLQALRKSLRDLMLASSLCQGKQFVEELEKVYRKAWEAYCDAKPDADRR